MTKFIYDVTLNADTEEHAQDILLDTLRRSLNDHLFEKIRLHEVIEENDNERVFINHQTKAKMILDKKENSILIGEEADIEKSQFIRVHPDTTKD